MTIYSVLVIFLILSDTLLFKVILLYDYFEGIWILPIYPPIWCHNGVTLRQYVNQIMLSCWKSWLHLFILCNFGGRIISGFQVWEGSLQSPTPVAGSKKALSEWGQNCIRLPGFAPNVEVERSSGIKTKLEGREVLAPIVNEQCSASLTMCSCQLYIWYEVVEEYNWVP